ncbi:MAG TPA: BppU family phage baseplate upper protein [Bellilinea sp.]|nr:BppU family phage baseplate upper protein [Bellilinea sp.]
MAVIFSEHFEVVGFENTGWSKSVGTGSIVDEDYAAGLPEGFESQALRCYSTGNNAYTSVTFTAVSTAYVRIEFYAPLFPLGQGNIVSFVNGRDAANNLLFTLRLYGGWGDGPRHNIVIYNDTRGTQYVSADSTYIPANKQVVEIKYDVTNNAWEWRLNGVIKNSGALNAGVGALNKLDQLGIPAQSVGTIDTVIDNVAVSDSGYLGEYFSGPRTLYQSTGGAVTLAALADGAAHMDRGLQGSVSPTGGVNVWLTSFSQAVTGGLSYLGSLATQYTQAIEKGITGAAAFLGNLATQHEVGAQQYFKGISGSTGPSGEAGLIVRQFRQLSGQMSPASLLDAVLQAGGEFFQYVSGFISPSGDLSRSVLKPIGHYLLFDGYIQHLTQRLIAGQIFLSGFITDLRKFYSRVLGGVIGPLGFLNRRLSLLRQVAGSLSSEGGLNAVAAFLRFVTGGLLSVGRLTRSSLRTLSGSISVSGLVSRIGSFVKALNGVLTSAGQTVRNIQKHLDGLLPLSGGMGVIGGRIINIVGSLTSQGSLEQTKAFLRTLSGAVSSSGLVSRAAAFLNNLNGMLLSVGTVSHTVSFLRHLYGSLDITGTLSNAIRFLKEITGDILLAGDITTFLNKLLQGALTGVGSIRRDISVIRSGVLSFSRDLFKQISLQVMGGVVRPLGEAGRGIVGSIEAAVTYLLGTFNVHTAVEGVFNIRTAIEGTLAAAYLQGTFIVSTALEGIWAVRNALSGLFNIQTDMTGIFEEALLVTHLTGTFNILTALGGGVMTSENQNFEMYSGDTHHLDITVKNSNGMPVDLTGASITWALYDQAGTIQVTKTSESGISLTDPANGVFRVTLSPIDTDTLAGKYRHEAEITDVLGQVGTVTRGTATIKPDKANS